MQQGTCGNLTKFGPGSPLLLTFLLLRKSGDRMGIIPATCLVSQLFSFREMRIQHLHSVLDSAAGQHFSICENSWESHLIVAYILRLFLLQQACSSTPQSWRSRGIRTGCWLHFSEVLSSELRYYMQACVFSFNGSMDELLTMALGKY